MDCEDGVFSVQLDDGSLKEDIPLPTNEHGNRIKRFFLEEEKDTAVTFLAVLGEEVVFSVRELPRQC